MFQVNAPLSPREPDNQGSFDPNYVTSKETVQKLKDLWEKQRRAIVLEYITFGAVILSGCSMHVTAIGYGIYPSIFGAHLPIVWLALLIIFVYSMVFCGEIAKKAKQEEMNIREGELNKMWHL